MGNTRPQLFGKLNSTTRDGGNIRSVNAIGAPDVKSSRSARVAFALLLVYTVGCAVPSANGNRFLQLDPALLDGTTKPFVPHVGDGPFDSYLAMNLPFEPAEKLARRIEEQFEVSLKNRGEAHITVVTPPEYQRLQPYLSMEQINRLAAHIQTATLTARCVGRATATLDGVEESTYFLVVDAPGLLTLRREIHDAFVAVGGAYSDFDPDAYQPHITLGFTRRDLHERDGAIKDWRSCIAPTRLRRAPQQSFQTVAWTQQTLETILQLGPLG